VNRDRVLNDLQLDIEKFRITESILDRYKREFIRDYVRQGFRARMKEEGRRQGSQLNILEVWNIQKSIPEYERKIEQITLRLPTSGLNQFHRECIERDLKETIDRWYTHASKLPVKATYYGKVLLDT
jgi:hypothetical protein